MRVALSQHSFARGEITPRLHAKQDLELYYAALARLTNYVVTGHANAEKRPGTEFNGTTKDNGEAALYPFVFDRATSYQLEIGDQYLRAWFDGGLVLDGNAPSETVTPYTLNEIHDLSTAQLNDVLITVHKNHAPAQITRTTAQTFTHGPFETIDGPYLNVNPDQSKTLELTADGVATNVGEVSFTDGDGGTAEDIPADLIVGSIIAVQDGVVLRNLTVISVDRPGNTVQTGWTGSPIASTGNWSYDGKSAPGVTITVVGVGSIVTGTLTAAGHTPFDAARDVGRHVRILEEDQNAPSSAPLEDRFEWHFTKIIAVNSATEAIVEWDKGSLEATADWRLGAFYPGNWPERCALHDTRLCFAVGNIIYMSAPNDFTNFSPTDPDSSVNPDNAITTVIPAVGNRRGKVSSVSFMISLGFQLVVGTPTGLHTIQSSSFGEGLEPGSDTRRPQDSRGAGPIEPIMIGDSVIFANASGKKLMGTYSRDTLERIGAKDISLSADHITQRKIKGIVWQEEPYSIAWVWFEDGSFAGVTIQPEEKVQAWHQHVLGGEVITAGISGNPKVESMSVIPGAAGQDDRVSMVVQRTVGIRTVRSVERLTLFRDVTDDAAPDLADSWFLDAALRYEGNTDPAKQINMAGEGLEARTVTTTFSEPAFEESDSLGFFDGVRWHFGTVTGVDPTDNSFTWTPAAPNAGPGPTDGRYHNEDGEWKVLDPDAEFDIYAQTYVPPVEQLQISKWSRGVTTLSGLDTYKGAQMQVLCDGYASGLVDVTESGRIEGLKSCHRATAGFPYAAKGKLLSIEGGTRNGSSQDRQRPVYEVAISVLESLGLEAGTGEPSAYDGVWEQYDPSADEEESADALYSFAAPGAHTKWLRFVRDDGGDIEDPPVAWISREPYPSTIRAIISRTSASEGR